MTRKYTPKRYAAERAANIRDLARLDREQGYDLDLRPVAVAVPVAVPRYCDNPDCLTCTSR